VPKDTPGSRAIVKDRFIFIAAALESIELIQSYTADYDLPGFLQDRKTQDAVIRNLEIAGMRNVLAHEYLGVDAVMVWETVQINLEPLRQALEKMMMQNE